MVMYLGLDFGKLNEKVLANIKASIINFHFLEHDPELRRSQNKNKAKGPREKWGKLK